MSEVRLSAQSPMLWTNPARPTLTNSGLNLATEFPGYSNAQQLLSCPASPTSNPAAAFSLTGVQASLAAQVAGPVADVAPNRAVEVAGETGMAAGTVADAATSTARAAAHSGGHLAGMARVARVAGPVGTVVASGAQVVESGLEIRDARNNPNLTPVQRQQTAGRAALVGGSKIVGGLGGVMGGMAVGFMVGGPVGLIAGGVAGGFGGDWAGGKVGEAVGDTAVGRFVGRLLT